MQTDLCLKLPRKHLPLFGLCTAVVSATVLLECICMLKRWVGDTVQGKLYLEIALRAGLCFLAETSHSAAVAGGWSPLGWMFHPLFMMGAEQGYSGRGKPAFTAPGKRIALAKRHGGTERGNAVFHGAKARHKSKDCCGNKWAPVGKTAKHFSSGGFALFPSGISRNKRQLPRAVSSCLFRKKTTFWR